MRRRSERNGLMSRVGGLLAAAHVRFWMGTLDLQTAHLDDTVDPVSPHFRGPVIAIFWHEYLLCPLATRGGTNTSILASLHRDADWLVESAGHLGFQVVRGSSNRGGRAALLELLRANRDRNLGITPDGPRGPRRSVALGPIYLASKLGRPIVPLGIGYDRPRRMNTWDRFAVPRLRSRVRVLWGNRIEVPANLGRGDLERLRATAQRELFLLTDQAEAWASSGERYPGQHRLRHQPTSWTEPHAERRDKRNQVHVTPPPIRWRNPREMPWSS